QNISNYFFDFSNAYFLPASKSGLYAPMSGMGEIIADLSQYRDRTNLKIDLAPLTKPVADYYKQLINSTDFDPPLRRNNYIDKAEEIEEEILGGKIRINKNRKVVFSDNNSDLNLEIVYTASMIAELAPLVLYLKNAINQSPGNPILIIEEPEAHLHPEVQVKLMEIFVELAKQNVKIIMTSHSNYMFNKLSNLLLEKKIEPEKVGIYHMEMTDKGSIVKDDMSATSEGIEDNNFATVAEKLYNERLAIYHQLNEDQNAYNTTEK
ncbi:MAG: AAA family ATPase, partial [Bacteroidota bacterium]